MLRASLPAFPRLSPALLTRVASGLIGLSSAVTIVAAPPEVRSIVPLGVSPGQSAEMVVDGRNLEPATQLWTSWGATAAPTQTDADSARFAVAIPSGVPLGVQAVRVLSPNGASELQLIVVDDLTSVAEESESRSTETAQALTLPCAVDGRIEKLTRDYYQFEARAGQQLSFEVLARRLGSPLDPAMFLYRQDGRELAYADDTEGLSGDPQLCYTFDRDGTYVLEVRDIRYAGGREFVYRLRIGDFPCLNTPYPLGVRRGQQTRIDFAGQSVGDANPAWAEVPRDWPHPWYPVSTRRADGEASGFTLVAVSDADECLEREPNNTLPQANAIALGTQINGRFDSPDDVDRYQFSAKKGQRYIFKGVTRDRGAPTDLVLQLLDSDGKQVARVDDAKTEEGTLDQTFEADGQYVLVASDLHRRGGPQYAYRIEVEPYERGFELAIDDDHLNVPAGGVGGVVVNVTRRGYDGAIRLSADGLPQGWEPLPTVIGPGMDSGVLTLRGPRAATTNGATTEVATTEAATTESILAAVRIVGTAGTDGGEDVREIATLCETLRSRWNQLPVVPLNVQHAFAIASAPAPPFTLTGDPEDIVFGKHLKATVQIIAQRGDGITEPIELATVLDNLGLPRDVKLKLEPIGKDANEVSLELTAGSRSPLGSFTLVLRGTHEKDKTTHTAIVPPIHFRLDPPLSVAASPSDRTLKRGAQLSIPITVTRNPALTGDIKLTLTKAPHGVTAKEVIVPADQSAAELVLTAANEAAAGAFSEIELEAVAIGHDQVTATTKIGKIVIE